LGTEGAGLCHRHVGADACFGGFGAAGNDQLAIGDGAQEDYRI